MPDKIRILIVEDHPTTRVGLRIQLTEDPQLEVVEVAETVQEALEKCAMYKPDVILLDLHLPDSNGPRTLISTFTALSKVVVFSAENRQNMVDRIQEMGALYVSKADSIEVVAKTIKKAASQNPVCSNELSGGQAAGDGNSPSSENKSEPGYQDPNIGKIIDERYKIQAILGVGGYSTVYRGVEFSTQKPVAIKLLHSHLSSRDEVAARFKREAEAAAGLTHPNIASVLGVGVTEDGQPFMVMEYISGQSLETVLKQDIRLPYPRVIYIVRQVCAALQVAHDAGIVHRDVKPGNIYLGLNDLVKLLDFGLAKNFSGDGNRGFSLTATGTAIGTPNYMSPEQCRGLSVDGRSDIYSIGCIMHEMLTGKNLFDGPTLYDIMVKHVQNEPDYTHLNGCTMPDRLREVIARTLEKHPEDRYRSAKELSYELHQCEDSPEGPDRKHGFQFLKF